MLLICLLVNVGENQTITITVLSKRRLLKCGVRAVSLPSFTHPPHAFFTQGSFPKLTRPAKCFDILYEVTPTLNRISQVLYKRFKSVGVFAFLTLLCSELGRHPDFLSQFQFSGTPMHHQFCYSPILVTGLSFFPFSSSSLPVFPPCVHLSVNREYRLCTIHSVCWYHKVENKTDMVLVSTEL